MKALIPTANDLFQAMGVNEKLPQLEYVEKQVASLSPHTMEQVEKDLRRWANAGCPYAQEALSLLELDV